VRSLVWPAKDNHRNTPKVKANKKAGTPSAPAFLLPLLQPPG
jgi:hypothetical protein